MKTYLPGPEGNHEDGEELQRQPLEGAKKVYLWPGEHYKCVNNGTQKTTSRLRNGAR